MAQRTKRWALIIPLAPVLPLHDMRVGSETSVFIVYSPAKHENI
jgi:hypothetical protein